VQAGRGRLKRIPRRRGADAALCQARQVSERAVTGAAVDAAPYTPQSNGGWRCRQPPLSWSPHTLPRGENMFQPGGSVSCDLAIPELPIGCPTKAVKPLRVPLRNRAGHCCPPKLLSQRRAGPFPAGRSGKWERLRLAPPPHASSFAPVRRFEFPRPCGRLCPGVAAFRTPFPFPAGRSHREARQSHLPPSRTSLRGLWIKRIAGISLP